MVVQQNPAPLRLFEIEEEFPPISLWTTLGGYALIATVGSAIAISVLVSIPISVRVKVAVRPADEQGIVQAGIEGKVKVVNVVEGQKVRLGSVIAQLDDSALQAQKQNIQERIRQERSRNQAEIQEAQANLAQAQDQLNRYLVVEREAPGALSTMQIQQARQAVAVGKARLENAIQSSQVSRDEAELNQIESNIEKTIIRAPIDGTIFQLNISKNSYQLVQPSDSIAQIIPSNNTALLIKGCLPESEKGKVKSGDKVQIKFNAYPYPDYGTLAGKVVTVAPDTITPQENSSTANTSCYPVTILPDQSYLKEENHSIQIGMEAEADIISGEEKLIMWIFRQAKLQSGF